MDSWQNLINVQSDYDPETDWRKFWDRKMEKGNLSGKNLRSALKYVVNKDEALDFGAGSLADTAELVKFGFQHVTAADISPFFEKYNTEKNSELVSTSNLDLVEKSFDTFNFQKDTYDLINASSALRFSSPENFQEMFTQLKVSLKKDGILVCNIPRVDHPSNTSENDNQMFFTEEKAQALVEDMIIIQFKLRMLPKLGDASDLRNRPYFQIIAQKA